MGGERKQILKKTKERLIIFEEPVSGELRLSGSVRKIPITISLVLSFKKKKPSPDNDSYRIFFL